MVRDYFRNEFNDSGYSVINMIEIADFQFENFDPCNRLDAFNLKNEFGVSENPGNQLLTFI